MVALYLLALSLCYLLEGASALVVESMDGQLHGGDDEERARHRSLFTAQQKTAQELADLLAGPNVKITSVSSIGDPKQFAIFSNGLGSDDIGIDTGIILSTGTAAQWAGENKLKQLRTQFFSDGGDVPNGYDALESINGGKATFDAAVLQIDFECTNGDPQDLSVAYVFGSDEYPEFVGTLRWLECLVPAFDSLRDLTGSGNSDVFAFFLNGQTSADNIATLTRSSGRKVNVQVDVVNCGTVSMPNPSAEFCSLLVDNQWRPNRDTNIPPGTVFYDTELDGFTVPLLATGQPQTGTNTIILAIADVGDDQVDTGVFLEADSLRCNDAAPVAPPTPRATRAPTTRAPTTPAPTPGPTTRAGGIFPCLQRIRENCYCSLVLLKGSRCPWRVIKNQCNLPLPKKESLNEIIRRYKNGCRIILGKKMVRTKAVKKEMGADYQLYFP